MIRKIPVAIFTILVSTQLLGCSPCESALPVITAAQTYVHDASVVVDQVEAMFASVDLTPDKRKEFNVAVSSARGGLRAADEKLRLASGACTQPDPVVILSEFIKAWAVIAPFILAHSPQLGASHGQTTLPTPAIVLEAQKRGQ